MRKQNKPRTAYVLFANNTPFKPKIVRDKTKYTRKVKHKNAN